MIQNQAFYFPIPKSRLVVANSAKCEGFNHAHGSYAASLMFIVVFRIDKKGEYFLNQNLRSFARVYAKTTSICILL